MQKRYQYCMSGMFAATDQNHYEINIPSPHTYETEEEAMADGAFGYRFVLLPGGKGPQVVIFEGSGFRLVCDGKENYIKDWVEPAFKSEENENTEILSEYMISMNLQRLVAISAY